MTTETTKELNADRPHGHLRRERHTRPFPGHNRTRVRSHNRTRRDMGNNPTHNSRLDIDSPSSRPNTRRMGSPTHRNTHMANNSKRSHMGYKRKDSR